MPKMHIVSSTFTHYQYNCWGGGESMYKWIYAVQTHVVQGSTYSKANQLRAVFLLAFFCIEKLPDSLIFFFL